jgi:hypothetical protein
MKWEFKLGFEGAAAAEIALLEASWPSKISTGCPSL